uniref:SHSP domain-containing protein n=1 Tax=Latimeria chalumnae TaxID=7897 RepID=H3ARJ3_LATCH
MMSPSAFEPLYDIMSVFQEPVRALWMVTPTVVVEIERDTMKYLADVKRYMDSVSQVHPFPRELPAAAAGPGAESCGNVLAVRQEADGCVLLVDVRHFSPEELSVKVAGRKLQVVGKRERRVEDGRRAFYHSEEFRKEYELPADVSPDLLTCSLSKEGRLCIKVPQRAAERECIIPINFSTSITVTLCPGQRKEEEKADRIPPED